MQQRPIQELQRSGTIAHPPDEKRRLEKRERKRRQSLDGDGSWRQTTGERREEKRRGSDGDDSHIINLPFLDDEFDTESESSSSGLSDYSSAQTTQQGESLLESSDETNTNNQTVSNNSDANSENTEAKTGAVSDTKARKSLSPEEQARLSSLKTMLNASNARYKQATRNRRPIFAAGLEVLVTKGDFAGKQGVVLDADYIENRALVSLPDQASPQWIGFGSLGHSD